MGVGDSVTILSYRETQEPLDSLSDSHHLFADDISCSPSPIASFSSTPYRQLWDYQQPYSSTQYPPSVQSSSRARQFQPTTDPTPLPAYHQPTLHLSNQLPQGGHTSTMEPHFTLPSQMAPPRTPPKHLQKRHEISRWLLSQR